MSDEWSDWEKHLIKELKCLRTEVSGLKTELALLKFKSGLWGFAAGALPVVGSLMLWILKNQLSS